MPSGFLVAVSGANRGIGEALSVLLASSGRVEVLLCCSRAGKASAAVDEAAKKSGCKVLYARLDITAQASIDELVSRVEAARATHGGKLPVVLVNNASVNTDYGREYNSANVKQALDTVRTADLAKEPAVIEAQNYRGTVAMAKAFLPLTRDGGRIVSLSSAACQNLVFDDSLARRFDNTALTLDEIDQLVNEYEASVASPIKDDHWPHDAFLPSYSVSKYAMNYATKVLARDNPTTLINSCCPGSCDTEMGNLVPADAQAAKTAADGAKIPLELAIGDIGTTSGKYWANDVMASKEDGHVIEKWQGIGSRVHA